MVRPFRRGIFNRVGLNAGETVLASQTSAEDLQARVAALLE
jgi:hypothetical protein